MWLNDIADDPLTPLHLLVYATQTALTTATCIADFAAWPHTSPAEKVRLAGLYVPYLAVGEFSRLLRLFSGPFFRFDSCALFREGWGLDKEKDMGAGERGMG